MKNKRLNILIGIVALICTIVAIFTLFANAFADVKGLPDPHGSAFDIMNGKHDYNGVPGLVAAFVFLIVSAVFSFGTMFLPGKLNSIISVISGGLLIAAGIIFFSGNAMFISANSYWIDKDPSFASLKIGVGLIIPAIFSLLGGLLSVYAAYKNLKA